MSDSMFIEGKEYISSKRASELSGYAQDYIGQLARKGLIDAQRVGGLWFVSQASLTEYKSNADRYVPQLPQKKEAPDVGSLISFDGKDHVSASRAAKITGYHPDYVGQLARSGAIISRQVGNRWYIDREGILAHKQEKDRLLGAVQAQSVGLARGNDSAGEEATETRYNGPGPFLTYTRDDRELLPTLTKSEPDSRFEVNMRGAIEEGDESQEQAVPIRKIHGTAPHSDRTRGKSATRAPAAVRTHGKTIHYAPFRVLATAALTIVIVLSLGFVTLKNTSVYTTTVGAPGEAVTTSMLASGAAAAIERIGEFIQNLLVKELIYKRVE